VRSRPLALALAAAALAVSCSQQDRANRRIAILPFENLSANPALEWMGRGFAEAVRLQLEGCPRTEPITIVSLRDLPAARATQVLEGYFDIRGGRLHVEAVLQDARRIRHVGTLRAAGSNEWDPLPLARAVAAGIDPLARPLPTNSPAAFAAYIEGIAAINPTAADSGFDRAVGADPGFAAAYVEWLQSLTARGDTAPAIRLLAAARQRSGAFPALERARLDLTAARLAGDRAGERNALVALTRTDPADTSVYRRLSELDAAAHSFGNAAAFLQQAADRDPDDVLLLNQLGYLRAWAGDLGGAVKALERYRSMRPDETNPIDSLGDVYYWSGRFSEAERTYREAYAKSPAFLDGVDLYKAAWARLFAGDRNAADAAMAEYLQSRASAGDPLVEWHRAEWEHASGRQDAAVARLERFAPAAQPARASFAYAQLAIWAADRKDLARAREYALKAPSALPVGLLARFLIEPPASAAEWRARAASAFPSPAQAKLRRLALAYALLGSQQFADALGPLQELYDTADPSSPDWPGIPLAWALGETGKPVPALLVGNPAPNPAAEGPVQSLTFPRALYVRGVLAARQGRRDEAQASLKLFSEYSGASR
jgi:TolB-like protein